MCISVHPSVQFPKCLSTGLHQASVRPEPASEWPEPASERSEPASERPEPALERPELAWSSDVYQIRGVVKISSVPQG